MVLQERIELSTSPLPRECSTTELLQRRGLGGGRPLGVAGDLDVNGRPRKGVRPIVSAELRKVESRLSSPDLDRPAMTRYQGAMTGTPEKPKAARARAEAEERERRLKAALRANLQRRKAQARARDDDDGDGAGPDMDDKE